MNILIVEDDQLLAEQLTESLRENGHETVHIDDGVKGEAEARRTAYDVMIVDRMMPGQDGLAMISALREDGVNTPTLILSALGQVDDRVTGLRAGGDDYLAKPYAFSELLARVEILGRRNENQAADTTLTVADLVLDRIGHAAVRAGQKIVLQPREYRLLEYLMRNEGKLVTRTMLLQHVWDLHFDPQTNVIDVHIFPAQGARLTRILISRFCKPCVDGGTAWRSRNWQKINPGHAALKPDVENHSRPTDAGLHVAFWSSGGRCNCLCQLQHRQPHHFANTINR